MNQFDMGVEVCSTNGKSHDDVDIHRLLDDRDDVMPFVAP